MDTQEIRRPRFIDTIESPQDATRMKVIVLGTSRSGTLSLYKAFKILGYNPYHMVEVCAGGLEHFRMFHEYVRLSHAQSDAVKPYGRPEFDKWFRGFDAICEIPSYSGGTSVVDAYIDDPDVKFILTERVPAAFSRSINNSVGRFVTAAHSFPLGILKYFDAYNWAFASLVDDMYCVYSQGKMPSDPDSAKSIEHWYEEYTTTIKKYVPPERLLHVRLEDGLGWEQVCPFLGVDIPDARYPRGNDPDEFKKIVGSFLEPGIKKAFGILTFSVLTIAGAGAWWLYPRSH
ncbi:hypothetical protein FJTKL_11919 [Diaporthe vaccinii]|uniref:NAD dependent epimerase/dehydratase n=1 Tax=Diaporthe vaccinii TaxID=105482 RepID=A0ABR4FAN2_9PEZI